MTSSPSHSEAPTGGQPQGYSPDELLFESSSEEAEVGQKPLPRDVTVSGTQIEGDLSITGAAAIRSIPRLRTPPHNGKLEPSSYFQPITEWLGWVTSMDNGSFTAEVESKDVPGSREIVTFDIADVSEHDLDAVGEGAFFYWSVGYFTQATGQRSRMSLIRFKRLPKWPQSLIDRARSRAVEEAAAEETDGADLY